LNQYDDPKKIPEEEWQKVLPSEVYHVTREAGTERPFTGKYDKFFKPGKYNCISSFQFRCQIQFWLWMASFFEIG
jgi:peptide methionine sulfoxide reductase MsrB